MIRSLLFVLAILVPAGLRASPAVLSAAHAHNDYAHARPLHEALERGFGSVEADVHLAGGQLLVGHDARDLRPERTLAALYLEPLAEAARRNGGRIHAGGPALTLLVDLKTAAAPTYAALDAELARYPELFTTFSAGSTTLRAVTVIVSGNRPKAELATQPLRRAALDGRPDDLAANPPAGLVPWISENWSKFSRWQGEGGLPADDREKVSSLVRRAHAQGRLVRFWGTADRPAVWRELRALGIDVIGADDLAGLQRFLTAP